MSVDTQPSDSNAHTRVRQMVTGYWLSQAISVAAELGLADLVAITPRTSDELAEDIGAHPPSLFRLLRALAGAGVFRQLDDGRFELTPTAECLRSEVPGSLRDYAILFGDDRQWRAWNELRHSVATGETAYQHVFGTGFYDHLEDDEPAAQRFNRAMAGSLVRSAAAMVEAYDFAGMGTVVDVGGGDGTLLSALLRAQPHLHGVLVDREAAVRCGRQNLAANGLTHRCEAVVGDYFDSVPSGGDVYLLSRVLHVWDDDCSVRILAACTAAMKPDGRVLVMERVVPERNQQSFAKLGDLNLLVLTGGRERTESEYRVLLGRAGLELRGVLPTESEMSLVEATFPDPLDPTGSAPRPVTDAAP